MSTERLKARITALRAKTMDAGCTEAEAIAAAEAAARLMREHGLSEADIVMTQAQIRDNTVRATWRATLSAVIAHLTNTSSVVVIRHGYSDVIYYGRAPGPDIAVYLREVCVRAVETELKTFKDSAFYRRRRNIKTKRAASADFADGMVIRLRTRLIELFRAGVSNQARLEADAERDRHHDGLTEFKAPERETRFNDAREQGYRAGERVGLSHGVGTSRPLQLTSAGES